MAVARKGRAGIVTPGSVPTLPVEVDWSHPLANGLVACYVPGGSRGLVDLAWNGPLLTLGSGAIVGPTSAGAGLINKTASAGATSSSIPTAWRLANAGTVFVSADFYSAPGVGNALLWGMNYDASGTSPFNDYSIGITFASQKPTFFWNQGGTSSSLVSSTVTSPTSGNHSLAATFIVGGSIAIYQDAVSIGSGTWSGAAPTYTSPVAVLGANPAQPTRITNTGISVALTYNRALSAAEIAVLDRNPFCMLRPLRRPMFRQAASTVSGNAKAASQITANASPSLNMAASVRSSLSFRGSSAASLSLLGYARTGAQIRANAGSVLSASAGAASGFRFPAKAAGILAVSGTGRSAVLFSAKSAPVLIVAGSGAEGIRFTMRALPSLSLRGTAAAGIRVSSNAASAQILAGLARAGIGFRLKGAGLSIIPLAGSAHTGLRTKGRGTPTLTPFIPAQNVINIGMPQRGLPIADPKTGQVNQNWYLFFHALWQRGGGPIGN